FRACRAPAPMSCVCRTRVRAQRASEPPPPQVCLLPRGRRVLEFATSGRGPPRHRSRQPLFREREASMCTGTLRKAAALLGALFLAGACTDGSSNAPITSPSFAASSSSLPHINNTTLPIPVTISADFSAYDCSNNPGPQITFSGGSFLGGYGVEMTFTNNMKGTHTFTDGHIVDVTVMPANEQIVVPNNPVLGGVGGNPFISAQFIDPKGATLRGELVAGRGVQGAGW